MTSDWWSSKPRKISVITDNDNGWFMPYAEKLCTQIKQGGDTGTLYTDQKAIKEGDVAFYLSCMNITPPETMAKHQINLVVHESDLPKGKGFSPVTWQILEGLDDLPICLIEMAEGVDAGPIVYKDIIKLKGTELCDEIKHMQGQATIDLCMKYLSAETQPEGIAQSGEESFYDRRRPKDSELDLNKTLGEQINLLRVCDNENYPAFFTYKDQKYTLKIEKDNG